MYTTFFSSEGQNLLKADHSNQSAHSFLHFAQLFELFPSKETLQRTPMMVETLASVSALTRSSITENPQEQVFFCVRCAALWLFCEIVQWESKVT
jgi:hypothetical protein